MLKWFILYFTHDKGVDMSITNFEKVDSFCIIRLNDTKRKNVASEAMLKELLSHLKEIEQSDEILGYIITGTEECFCAGADIKESKNPQTFHEYLKLGKKVISAILNSPKISIAAVNGIAFGGGFELALACDMICGSKEAVFALPEVKLGLFPGWGGTQTLSQRVGPGIAKEMILTGRQIDYEEAYEIAILDKQYETNKSLLNGCLTLLNDIFQNCPQAVFQAKQLINLRYSLPFEKAVEKEFSTLIEWVGETQAQEGMSAFLEKRKPEWNR